MRDAFRVLIASASEEVAAVSLVDTLSHLSTSQTAALHISLQLASESVLTRDLIPAVEALGEVLELLGFTLVPDKRSER
jgi:hypothetical protein